MIDEDSFSFDFPDDAHSLTLSPASHPLTLAPSNGGDRARPSSIFTSLHASMAPSSSVVMPNLYQLSELDSPSTGTPGLIADLLSPNTDDLRINYSHHGASVGDSKDEVTRDFDKVNNIAVNNTDNLSVNSRLVDEKVTSAASLNDLSPGSVAFNAFAATIVPAVTLSPTVTAANSTTGPATVVESRPKVLSRSVSKERLHWQRRARRVSSHSGSQSNDSDVDEQPGSHSNTHWARKLSCASDVDLPSLEDVIDERKHYNDNDRDDGDDWYVSNSPDDAPRSLLQQQQRQKQLDELPIKLAQHDQPPPYHSINGCGNHPPAYHTIANTPSFSPVSVAPPPQSQSQPQPQPFSSYSSQVAGSSVAPVFPPLPLVDQWDSVDNPIWTRQGSSVPPMILEFVPPRHSLSPSASISSLSHSQSQSLSASASDDDRPYFRLLFPQSLQQKEDVLCCRKKRSQYKWRFSLDNAKMTKRGNDAYVGKMKLKGVTDHCFHYLLSFADSTPIANILVNHSLQSHTVRVELLTDDANIVESAKTGRVLHGNYQHYVSPLLMLTVSHSQRTVLVCDRVHCNGITGTVGAVQALTDSKAFADSKYSLSIDYPLSILVAFAVIVATESTRMMRDEQR